MRDNLVRRTLADGGCVFGLMMFELATPGAPRIADSAGADFVIWDLEHTGWTTETMRQVLAVARLGKTLPLVRVLRAEHHLITAALDVGAMGVMVPMVETAEQAELVVRAAKYPPMGSRGFGAVYADLITTDIADYCAAANRETLVWVLIETAAGVENAAEICSVPGVDGVWLGFHDLALSLGVPGDFTSPRFLQSVGRLIAAANQAGKPLGHLASTPADAKELISRGFRILAAGDLMLMNAAFKDCLDGMRSGVDGQQRDVV